MDGRPTWTDCGEAGDYVVPNVLSPRNLVSRPDIMTKLYNIHTKVTPDLHLRYRKNGGNLGLILK